MTLQGEVREFCVVMGIDAKRSSVRSLSGLSNLFGLSSLPGVSTDRLRPVSVRSLVTPGSPHRPPGVLILCKSLHRHSFSELTTRRTDQLLH